MSRKRNKRSKRYFLKIIILSIIFLYFISRMYPMIGSSFKRTYTAELGRIETVISTTGFIVRDEEVIEYLEGKEVEYFFDEGEKVGRGQRIADVKSNGIVKSIYSEEAGLVVFNSDGLENLFNLNSIEKIESKNLALIRNIMRNKQKKNQIQAIKIVTNHRWSIILMLEDEQVEKMAENSRVLLRRKDNEREYNALVKKIIYSNGENIVLLDLSEFMKGFYNTRAIQLDIVVNNYKGVILANRSIVEVNGQEGVFRIDYSGDTEFVPVKIKGCNSENSIVYYDFFNDSSGNGDNESSRVNTIDLFDEIWLEGSQAKVKIEKKR
ncbi:MAG: hypothetical protein LR001_02455 [Clostridiales bacterium]|nr:hypothetical protein [Clostridiales bacterium]